MLSSIDCHSFSRVWISPDHQCILWCKQLGTIIFQSLIDSVDADTKQICGNSDFRFKVAKYYFISNSAYDVPKLRRVSELRLLKIHAIHRMNDTQWSSSTCGLNGTSRYHFIDLQSMLRKRKSHVIARTAYSDREWIFGCSSADCITATDISHMSVLTPQFKIAKLNIQDLVFKNMSHLILSLPNSIESRSSVDVNLLSITDNKNVRHIVVPNTFSNLWTFRPRRIVIGRNKGVFYHAFILEGLRSIYQSYIITVTALPLLNKQNPLIAVKLPNSQGPIYSNQSEMKFGLITTAETQNTYLYIYTYGNTQYSFTIKPNFQGTLGRIIRFSWSVMPHMFSVNILLTFCYQMMTVVAYGNCYFKTHALELLCSSSHILRYVDSINELSNIRWFSYCLSLIGACFADVRLFESIHYIWFLFMSLLMFLFAAKLVKIAESVLSNLIKISSNLFATWLPLIMLEDVRKGCFILHAIFLDALITWSCGLVFTYIAIINFIELCALSSSCNSNFENGDFISASANAMSISNLAGIDSQEKTRHKELQIECDIYRLQSRYRIKFSMQLMWSVLMIMALPSVLDRSNILGYDSFILSS